MIKLNRKINRRMNENQYFLNLKNEIIPKLKYELDKIEENIKSCKYQEAESHFYIVTMVYKNSGFKLMT